MKELLTIGREEGNDIVISRPYLSEQHAILTIVDSDKKIFHIQDLDTTNGTFKNGQRVQDADFTVEDKITIADCKLEPTMYLPLLFDEDTVTNLITGQNKAAKKPAAKSAPSKKTSSKKSTKRHVVKRSRGGSSIFSLKSIMAVSIALVVAAAVGVGFNQSFDAYVSLQIFSLWVILMMAMSLSQTIMRGTNQLASEQQYRRILFDQWQRRMDMELEKQKKEETHEKSGWSGFRKFEIAKRVQEADDIVSFYLAPHDRKPLPSFRPGQYLTFQLDIPGQDKSVIRCYSLSDRFHENYYRVSIKKIPPPPKNPEAPPGLSSSFFHDELQTESIVDVKAPSGKFYLNEHSDTGVVLIAGGVGITPMVSMLNTLTHQNSSRDIWFFYGVRNGAEMAMKKHLKAIDEQFDNVHMHLCFSNPGDSDVLGEDYHHAARVSVDLFKELLPSNNFEYYMCGPPPMMQGVTEALDKWGVPEKDVYFEAFGPASVKKKKAPAPAATGVQVQVEFAKSDKKVMWTPDSESILEFAENNGVEMAFGCRAGNCGTCQVAVRSGDVRYTSDHDVDVESGSCLACISVPDGNIVLDA